MHQTATFPDIELSFNEHKRYGIFRSKMATPLGDINGVIASTTNGPSQALLYNRDGPIYKFRQWMNQFYIDYDEF